jgi:hypothetical protein
MPRASTASPTTRRRASLNLKYVLLAPPSIEYILEGSLAYFYGMTNLPLQSLSSNPKGPLDDHVAETAKKTVDNVAGDIKQ